MSNVEMMIMSTKWKLEVSKNKLEEAKSKIASTLNESYINTDGMMHDIRRIHEAQVEISILNDQLSMLYQIEG